MTEFLRDLGISGVRIPALALNQNTHSDDSKDKPPVEVQVSDLLLRLSCRKMKLNLKSIVVRN